MDKIAEQGFAEQNISIRHKWPKGFFGSIAYFTDHIIFRFNKPIDWHAAQIAECGFVDVYLHRNEPDLSLLDKLEIDVFTLMALGQTNIEIGETLGLPLKFVCNAVHAVKEKLGTYHFVDVKALAVKNGVM